MVCVLLCCAAAEVLQAQKLITYEAGMGTRDPENADVWILYQRVRAVHEGMVLHADSALLNTVQNDFTAYGDIVIELSDTTTITGDRLFYDANTRVADIWAAPPRQKNDTVRLVDGKTLLRTNHLSYDRNTSTATYNNWAWTTNEDKRLVSRVGHYNSDTKDLYIYVQVDFADSNMHLVTDSLTYNTSTCLASYWTPTTILTNDSTLLYSEQGTYNTDLRFAHSTRASEVRNAEKHLFSDTLLYYEASEYGRAMGHVLLRDTVNRIFCTGRYGETARQRHQSFVTDSAMVRFVTEDTTGPAPRWDTLYLHADTVLVENDSSRQFVSVSAASHVKAYRYDSQMMCDSAYYSVADSLLTLFGRPVLWYGSYQCSADTILMLHDSAGARKAYLRSNNFNTERLDDECFNQLKGRNAVVYFAKGEPDYADILGNAEMVYYITDEDSGRVSLIGVNVGRGADMRIYFKNREPDRVATYDKPDMDTYPLDQAGAEQRVLKGFCWLADRRPKKPADIFVW